MNSTVRNILAVIAGLIIGSIVNMAIIMVSGSIISPPEGADTTTMEGLKESIHLFQPRHFVFPFLAHALGTLVGAFFAALIASNYKMKMALIVGVFFLIGGIINTFLIPAPTWFIIIDLVVAYLAMAWIGGKLAMRNQKSN